MTDSDDAEMFDNVDEDKDLASQVSKSNSGEGEETSDGLPQAPSPPANEKKSGVSTETKTEPATKDTPATETKTEKKEEEAKAATSATTKD